MKFRELGKTGFKISEISLGTWQVGGKWGTDFDDANADKILRTAIDRGINFIDTADVYSAGLSEKAVGRAIKDSGERVYVASKCGRQISPHVNEGYTAQVLRKYVEDSLRRLNLECLDLIQLHCPPWEVYYRPEIFGLFEDLKSEGKILNMGVSVEKIEQAIKAMEFENVTTVQIIFNLFRQRPSERFFPLAQQKNVGIIVRVPLASGMLTGMYTKDTSFEKDDHRNFNRDGAAFDKGETFSGIPYEKGLEAVDQIKTIFPNLKNLAPLALEWILSFPEVSCIIPGASRPEQVISNLSVYDFPELSEIEIQELNDIYKKEIKPYVHQLW